MSKLLRKKSQVASDFNITLKAVVKTVTQTDQDVSVKEEFTPEIDELKKIERKLSRSESLRSQKLTMVLRNRGENRDNEINEQSSKSEITSDFDQRSINSEEKTWKIPYFLRNLFHSKSKSPRRFSLTDANANSVMVSLPFNLSIYMDKKMLLSINVIKHQTIEQITGLIAPKIDSKPEQICLFHKRRRLEKNVSLSTYHINVNSQVHMKILNKIKIFGNFSFKKYSISIYTTERVFEVKILFSKKIHLDPASMELYYKNVVMTDLKDIFLFDIVDGSVIEIERIEKDRQNNLPTESIPAVEVVQRYLAMTMALEKCECKEMRLNAIGQTILAVINKKTMNSNKILSEFGINLHHKTCSKFKMKSQAYSTTSEISQSYDESEISVEDCIFAEIDRTANNKKIVVQDSDLNLLTHAKNFKEFKRILKERIGTKCDLQSVAMLYKCGIDLVIYVGGEEENPVAKRMLHYIRNYFHKYFEKHIIENGGLAALSLTSSDID